ncbi:MAG: aspartate aminotransferase family protein [Pseudomonadota bacterium]
MIAPVMPTYARAPLEFERGEGAWLMTAEGEKFLDFGAGIAVNCLGHAHPKLVEALETQARRVWHVSNLYNIPRQQELADKLVANTFADTMFFCNSGAEAMELAIKIARKHFDAKGQPERVEIITFEGAFHGRTLGTISSAYMNPKLVDGFGPLLPGFKQVPFGDHDALKAAIGPETAAIMIEPIQGEGGIKPVPHQCLRGLRELCDEHGILLIFDEIQCGVGRTGTLFFHEQAGVTPDVMGIAKGIGGGFPLGACLATEDAACGMVPGTHGSTYGGNPLGCAIGSAVMDELLAPDFLDEVKRKASLLRQRLAELADTYGDMIEEVRGEGLMLGVRFKAGAPAIDIVNAAYDAKMLTVPAAENTVRLLPPLNVTDAELGACVERLGTACKTVRDKAAEAA